MSETLCPRSTRETTSMDTPEREVEFEARRGFGMGAEYADYRKKWTDDAKGQIVRDYPLLVDIELSSLCNLKLPDVLMITDEFSREGKHNSKWSGTFYENHR